MKCDSCQMVAINGVPCHETGCPNAGKVYRDGEWIKQHECRECGTKHDDADDAAMCCMANEEDDEFRESEKRWRDEFDHFEPGDEEV